MHRVTPYQQGRSLLLASLAVLAPVVLAGQQDPPSHAQSALPLLPGDALLRPDQVRPGIDSFRIESYRDGVLTRSSTLTRSITRAQVIDGPQFVFAQTYRTPQGMTHDTSWVDAGTLAPIQYAADVYGSIQRVQFSGREARGTVTVRDSAPRSVTLETARPFFNAVALDLVYGSIPWEPGRSVEFLALNPPGSQMTIHLQVIGVDTLDRVAGSAVPAWLLDYRAGPLTQRLWLDRRTGEFLRIGSERGGSAFYKYRADLKPPPVRTEIKKERLSVHGEATPPAGTARRNRP
jgi:hypothetical protein